MKKTLMCFSMLVFCGIAMANSQQYDGVAAYVDDKVITIDTVMNELRSGLKLWQAPLEEQMQLTRTNFPVFRDLIIDRMLILKQYEASGAQLPAEAVNERVQSIIAESYEGNEAKLRNDLMRTGLTYPEWLKQVRENMIVQAMRHLQVNKKIQVSPKRVRDYYNAHPEMFSVAEAIHVKVLLLPQDYGREAANLLLADLRKGVVDFATVAKEHSIGQNAEEGGDLGFVKPEEEFAPVIVEALMALNDGAISDVIELNGCYAILQKVASKNAKPLSLKEAWPVAYAKVEQALGMERYKQWIEGLRKRAHIRYVDVAL